MTCVHLYRLPIARPNNTVEFTTPPPSTKLTFSEQQAQGRILNHELAEGLEYTPGKVMADVDALRRASGSES